jgi:hypothetical protein
MTPKPTPLTTLVLRVTFDDYPSNDDLAEILDAARSNGEVVDAQLTTTQPINRDLLREGV